MSPTSVSPPEKKLGLLYRTFHLCDQQSLSRLYKVLVPKFDYCCCVWDPSTSVLVKRLESVNKFAAKICTKRWSGPSPLSLLGWVLFISVCHLWNHLPLSITVLVHLNYLFLVCMS